MAIVRNFKLFLNAGSQIPLVIHANQYDSGEQWRFTLYNQDGSVYEPSSGAIVGIKSDGHGIINTGAVSGGKVVITETQQMTAAVGKNVFELLIDDQTHGTANFVVLVEPRPGDQADFSESDLSLLEQAIEGTSAAAIAQGVSDWMDDNLTPTTPVVDSSLTVSGAAADAKKTGDEISALKSAFQSGGVPHEVKLAMDTLFAKMGVKDDAGYAGTYAVIHAWATAVNLISISAVFEQGNNIILDVDDLEALKQYLTVTATYDDGTIVDVSTYTLSGTLTAGTSYITVTYEDQTTSFAVTVTGTTDVTPAFSTFAPSNATYCAVSYNSENNSLRVYTKSNRSYQNAYHAFTMEEGYTYRLEADLTVTKGHGRMAFAKANDTIVPSGTTTTAESGHFSTDVAYNSETAKILLYCSFNSTAEAGDVTFSNFKVYKYIAPLEA